MIDLEEMLASGKLAEAARGCKTQKELAGKLGLSADAYELRIRRIRKRGGKFPTLLELLGVAPATSEPAPVPTIDDALADRRERAELTRLRAQLNEAVAEVERLRLQHHVATEAEQARGSVPHIERQQRGGLLREAAAVAVASDWHIEERVDAAAVNGVNEFNLDIARERVTRFFSGVVYLIRYHEDHFAISRLVLALIGDLITGYLRAENLESNEASPSQAIAHLHVWISEGIQQILAETSVDIDAVCLSGNHGRLTDKVRPSTREANSIEWLLYVGLAREFANEPRVRFHLPQGQQTYFQIYDWTIRFLHGDGISYGSGVGGITIPINKAIARWQTVRHADLTVMGHFHQYHDLPNLVVNGSLIGYSPYSLSFGAGYEEPRQAFFLIDAARGKTMPADIWVKQL